jgi:hypothetical protein
VSNDSSLQIPTIIGSFTELQQKVLSQIGRTYKASYNTLVEDLHKDRITILQSVESLVKHQYVDKVKVFPDQPKSMLIFILTHKGIAATWLRGFLSTKDILYHIKYLKDDNIGKYINVIYDTFSPSQHRQMLESIFRNLEWSHSGFAGEERSRSLIKDAFLTGILKLAFANNYDPNILFNKTNVDRLKWLFSDEDLKLLKEMLKVGRNNITLTIKKFPV